MRQLDFSRGLAAIWTTACLGSALAAPPPAHSHFQIVGVSTTHVALRELFDDTDDAPAECGYHIAPRQLGQHGVRIHLVAYRPRTLLPVDGHSQVLPIYDSAARTEDCTPFELASTRLTRAKAQAQESGVTMDARTTPQELGETLQPEQCGADKSAQACTVSLLEGVTAHVKALDAATLGTGLGLAISERTPDGGHLTQAHEEGGHLKLLPLQLYTWEGRQVLLAVFQNGDGRERPYILVMEPASTSPGFNDEPSLTPLTTEAAP